MFTSQVSNAGSINSPNKCLGYQEDVQWKSSKFTELWCQIDTVDSKLAAQRSKWDATTLGNLVSQNKFCLRESKLNIDMSVVVISSFFMAMKFLGDAV